MPKTFFAPFPRLGFPAPLFDLLAFHGSFQWERKTLTPISCKNLSFRFFFSFFHLQCEKCQVCVHWFPSAKNQKLQWEWTEQQSFSTPLWTLQRKSQELLRGSSLFSVLCLQKLVKVIICCKFSEQCGRSENPPSISGSRTVRRLKHKKTLLNDSVSLHTVRLNTKK